MAEYPKLLNVKQAAEVLNVCPDQVYQLVHRADFPTIRLGRCIRINRDALNIWADKQTNNIEQLQAGV